MKPLAHALGLALLALSPDAVHAAPVTLQYSVEITDICYLEVPTTCPAGPFTGFTLTLTYDDVMTEDRSAANFRDARFGAPTMTMSGGSIAAFPNPYGTITEDLSELSMRRTFSGGFRDRELFTSVHVSYKPTHLTTDPTRPPGFGVKRWEEWITLSRGVATGADTMPPLPTAADLLAELSSGTFQFSWSSSASGQSGDFVATGVATALGPVPSTVPEPASLLLVGLGLIAGGVRVRLRRRRVRSC